MIAELIKAGYFKEVTTEGRKEWILKSPVNVVIKAAVLADLKKAYPLHEETGGILYAFPINGDLVVTRFTILPNQLGSPERKTAYKPLNSALESSFAVAQGALPIRFHSHPVEIYENPYDQQPLTFFQKTSSADRHNAYLPLTIEGYTVVLPDGLLSANDRAGTDIRFYLYGGLVAPDSLKALLTSEKVYIYFVIAAVFFAFVFGSKRSALKIFAVSAVASIAVFLIEKRPTTVKNGDGDLVIAIS